MIKNQILPELLSPAGNFNKMEAAFRFGADAVYLSGKRFGMRASADNFSPEQMRDSVSFAHKLGKKVYVTLNVMPREDEFHELEEYLEILSDVLPDALIVADLGVFSLCKKNVPQIPIHISTQAAAVNSYSCNAWYDLGATRVVLARELSLSEISALRRNIPDELELETFVHGSMCVSFSGRCMLSEYYTGRDANRGACTQPCRWQYRFYEEKRPDDVLDCEIHPEGTYIFGSKDLCMVDHLKELTEAGINSFKIEGRMKSAYYTALVTNAYRIAMNDLDQNSVSFDALIKELESVSHREFCTGYYFDRAMEQSNLASSNGYLGDQSFLATVLEECPDGLYRCQQNNKFSLGDTCEFITPGKIGQRVKILGMYDKDQKEIENCPHPQMIFYIKADQKMKAGDLIRKQF